MRLSRHLTAALSMRSSARFTDCLVTTVLAGAITAKPEIGLMGARRPLTHYGVDARKTVQARDEKNGGEASPAPIGVGYLVNHVWKRSVNSSR